MLTANTTNLANGNLISADAPAGANNDPGSGGTYSGFGNSSPGGATQMRVVNASNANFVLLTVANNGANTGQTVMLPSSEIVLSKYPYDLLFANATANLFVTPVASRGT
jgi:hypothetical protein